LGNAYNAYNEAEPVVLVPVQEEPDMRMLAFIVTLFAAASPAAALDWKEYAYPDNSFTVSFPADPTIEKTTYTAANGQPAEARVYAVTQDRSVFQITVVDLSKASLEEKAVIDHAIKTLSQGGEIKLDIPHRISAVYGRQLSIVGADGSRSSIAVFYHKGRLYQIEGKTLGGNSGTADTIRFQQSLVFDG
jgi:hypothetical protein